MGKQNLCQTVYGEVISLSFMLKVAIACSGSRLGAGARLSATRPHTKTTKAVAPCGVVVRLAREAQNFSLDVSSFSSWRCSGSCCQCDIYPVRQRPVLFDLFSKSLLLCECLYSPHSINPM